MSALTLFRVGGALAVLTGALHLLGRFGPEPADPAFVIARDAMQAFSLSIAGVTTTLHQIVELLDWLFSLSMMAIGGSSLTAARALAAQPGALRAVSLVNVVGLGAMAIAAIAHRVAPPAFFLSLCALAFAAASLRGGIQSRA